MSIQEIIVGKPRVYMKKVILYIVSRNKNSTNIIKQLCEDLVYANTIQIASQILIYVITTQLH